MLRRKIISVATVGLLASACIGAPTDEAGDGVRSTQQAVLGGSYVANPTPLEENVVTLSFFADNLHCTGTLIRPQWVLTAGHCLAADSGAPKPIISQMWARTPDGSSAGFDQLYIHPDIGVDAGLIRLSTPLPTDFQVQLYSGWADTIAGTSSTIYGSGPISHRTVQACSACTAAETCADGNTFGSVICTSGGISRSVPKGSLCTATEIVTNASIEVLPNGPTYDCRTTLVSSGVELSDPLWNISKNTGPMTGFASNGALSVFNKKQIWTNVWAIPGDSGGPSFLANSELVSVNGGWEFRAYAGTFRDWVRGIVEPTGDDSFEARVIHGYFSILNELPMTGDFNGDGRADLVTFIKATQSGSASGNVYVSIANADGSYQPGQLWHGNFANGPAGLIYPKTGDFDGDGNDDIVYFDHGSADAVVALSNGSSGFGDPVVWKSDFSYSEHVPDVGDFNGDGRDDIVTFVQYNGWGDVWVSLSCNTNPGEDNAVGCSSAGAAFGDRQLWHPQFSDLGEAPRVGDFNGDGLDDIANVNGNSGNVDVALTQRQPCSVNTDCPGNSACFTGVQGGVCPIGLGVVAGAKQTWITGFNYGGQLPEVGDFNGDGLDDIVSFKLGAWGAVFVAESHGSSLGNVREWNNFFATGTQIPAVGDSNRDGRDDIFMFVRNSVTGGGVGDVWVGISGGIPENWTCSNSSYDAQDGCDCGCGALDPDCDDPSQQVDGCVSSEASCSAHGECREPVNPEPDPALTPCSGICSNPTTFPVQSYHVSLGSGSGCFETTFPLQSGNCGGFDSSRTMTVNGVEATCNYQNLPLPSARNGGYCFSVSAGGHDYAGLNTW